MDHGRYADGVKIVEATHRRYLRAGQPWNHVECGEHYSRAMSSWATMLAATGFKPDMANAALAVMPSAPGDFRAPWVTAWGFGTISRSGRSLSIHCESGRLELKSLKLRMAAQSARVGERPLAPTVTSIEDGAMVEFSTPLSLAANQTLTIS